MAIRLTETASFLSKTRNWISPGSDKIPNYWLKAFPATHSCIMKIFNKVTEEPKQMPDWLTTGMILKNWNNMLTGINARRISTHLVEEFINRTAERMSLCKQRMRESTTDIKNNI
jgi:hypothetical protein